MEKAYVYKVVKENFNTGERSKRIRKYYSYRPCLTVGSLYAHLGSNFRGCYRVLSVDEQLIDC